MQALRGALQVCQGSLWEGGLRFEVELEAETEASQQLPYKAQGQGSSEGGSAVTEEDADGPQDMEASWKERGWVPLVHAPANGKWPAVLIRQPLQPDVPPTPAVEWRVGERVEVRAVLCSQSWLLLTFEILLTILAFQRVRVQLIWQMGCAAPCQSAEGNLSVVPVFAFS